MKKHFTFIVCVFLLSCNGEQKGIIEEQAILKDTLDFIKIDSSAFLQEEIYIVDSLEQKLIQGGLVNIQDIIPGLLIDVRYSTTNNFMNQDVYGNLNRIYLQKSVAEDLLKCQNTLKELDSNLTLLVFDGVRPRSVQQIMWDVLDMPTWEKTKFVSNPKNGSIHNYGCAVDLTISNIEGIPLDMGAGYDEIDKIAYPRYEKVYLDSGLITQNNIDNREMLRTVLRSGGFWGIETEWWHFNRYNREKCKELFEIVE